MLQTEQGGYKLLRFERLARESRLVHAFVSKPANWAPHRGLGAEQAIEHRRRVCEVLGVPFEQLTSPEQIQGAEVLPLEPGDIGRGRDGRGSAVRFIDGLITDRPDVPIILMSADCPLLVIFDPDRPALAAVHAGWQGTFAGIGPNAVRLMEREFGSRPKRLLVGIAPSAGPCCYEVGEEVRRLAHTRMPQDDADSCFRPQNGRYMLDMWRANALQLVAAGVPAEHIETAGLCTICNGRFWSHRRDGATAGRSALFVSLK